MSETFDAVDVTTYRWEIPFGELYESAPFAYSPFGVLDGNADPSSTVTLAISVDADGVVRVVDIRLDLDSVIDHATAKADGSVVSVRISGSNSTRSTTWRRRSRRRPTSRHRPARGARRPREVPEMQPSTSTRNIKGTVRRVVSWLAVAGLGVGGWFAYGSEPVQRALGNREQFRVEPPEVRPEYASAVVESVGEYVYARGESTISSTTVTTVDRTTQRASVSRTNAITGLTVDGQVPTTAAGQTMPGPSSLRPRRPRIVTFDSIFRKGATDADPWTRSPRPPYVGGTALDPYLIPTIDDVIGFELASIPGRDPRAVGGATGEIRPSDR